MPTIDEELIQNGKAVFHSKVEHTEDVTFGKNAEFDGQVQINSAKDLKTKDGTSFGGGDLPSPWTVNEKILGVEDTENKIVIGFLTEGGFLYGYQDNQAGEACYLSPVYLGNTSIAVYQNAKTQVESDVVLPDDFMTKSQVINLGDIAKKQSILYRHTITLHNKNIPSYFTFSIYMTQQAEITQETLFNVLNGSVVVGTGIVQNIFIDKISFRNTAEKTILHQYANFASMEYFDSESTFSDVFNTDYTLEDLVQIL